MALLKPNQLSPQNSVIDATVLNRFTWKSNGAKQEEYTVYIYNNDDDTLLYSSTTAISPNNYHDLDADSLTNGLNCKWYVNTTSGTDSQDSEYEYFETNKTPTVTFTRPDLTYGETWLINNFNAIADFDSFNVTQSNVTSPVLYEYGNLSIRLYAQLPSAKLGIEREESLDMTVFPSGEASTTSDYIYVVFYIEDLGQIDTNGVWIRFETSSGNYYEYSYVKTSISVGWNYIVVAKSSFTATGSPDWSTITSWWVGYNSILADDTIYFQALEMRQVASSTITIATQDYTFEVDYEQEQDVNLKAYKFLLYDSEGDEITDTGWIYDFNLSYEFTGFENNTSYQIECKALSQNNQEGTTGIEDFTVTYPANSLLPEITVTPNNDYGYISIDFNNIKSRNAVYSDDVSATPIYVAGKFGSYGIEVASGENVDLGSLTNNTDFTLTAWVQFITGFDGHLVNFDDTYYYGYDATLQRFYYFDGTYYTYSDTISLATLTGGYVFIGITNDYFVIRDSEVTMASIDTTSRTFPATITSCKFLGHIYLDNVHGQSSKLSNADLIAEEVTQLVGASSSTTAIALTLPTESVQFSSSRNLLYRTNGTTGYIELINLSGVSQDNVSFNANSSIINSQLLNLYDDVYFLAYQDNTASDCKLKTFSITGDVISVLDTESTNNSNNITEVNSVVMDTGVVLVAYRDSSTSKAYVEIVYAGATITPYTLYRVEINNGNDSTELTLVSINSTEAVLYYFDVDNNTLKNVHITRNGYNLSLADDYTVYSSFFSFVYMNDCILVDSTHIIYSFTYTTSKYIGITKINNTGLVNNYQKYTTSVTYDSYDKFKKITDNYYVIVANQTTNPYVQILNLDANYNVTFENTVTLYGVAFNSFCANSFDSSSLYVLFQSGGVANQVNIFNFTPTGSSVDKQAVWSTNSKFLADFEETLDAGNVPNDIVSYRLKRLAEDGNLYQILSSLTLTDYQYLDMTARNNINYTYALHAIDSNGNEDSGTFGTGELNFYGWCLTDGTNIYKFDMENDTSDIDSTLDITVFDNYTQYPTVAYGERNYRKGTMKTIPYLYNSTTLSYDISLSLLNELRAFINNSTVKYIKNIKGEIIKIATSNFSYKYYDNIPNQIYEITFAWIEIGVGEEGLD